MSFPTSAQQSLLGQYDTSYYIPFLVPQQAMLASKWFLSSLLSTATGRRIPGPPPRCHIGAVRSDHRDHDGEG